MLNTDIAYYKNNYPKLEQKNILCEKELVNFGQQVDTCSKILSGKEKDILDLTKVSNDFEKKYVDTSTKLIKCEDTKPSKFTWFSIGAASAIIASIAALFLVKK